MVDKWSTPFAYTNVGAPRCLASRSLYGKPLATQTQSFALQSICHGAVSSRGLYGLAVAPLAGTFGRVGTKSIIFQPGSTPGAPANSRASWVATVRVLPGTPGPRGLQVIFAPPASAHRLHQKSTRQTKYKAIVLGVGSSIILGAGSSASVGLITLAVC